MNARLLLVRLHVIHTFQHMAVTASLPHVSCPLKPFETSVVFFHGILPVT
jgi:hypothetical protein